MGAVRIVASHLDTKLADGDAEHVADEYSLSANKARTNALQQRLEQDGVDLEDPANSMIWDSTTLPHWNHLRDGSSGSWFVQPTRNRS